MMGFAERLHESCVSSDLESVDGKIHAVEHVAALSGAPSLGSDLLRAKDYDSRALSRAVLILARKVRQEMRLGQGPARQLAIAAIFELLHWQCRRCDGAAEQIIGGVRQTCPECGGTGVHRWRDSERAKAAGYPLETWHSWAKKHEQVLGIARRDDSETIRAARAKMG